MGYRANPAFECLQFPLSDGGDGTAEILTYHSQGKMVSVRVNDPLFRPVQVMYGFSKDGKTAFIEMAAASGLKLLKPEERNCLHTTTLGTGEMIMDAVRKGVKKIILGIGGSATNDAGIGLATALGYKFYDASGNLLKPTGENLVKIASIDDSSLKFNTKEIEVLVACDVENPLYGPQGAAKTYGPQKGADEKAIEILEEGLKNFDRQVKKKYGKTLNELKGAGAAGGLGAGAYLFLGGKLQPGIHLIMEFTKFEETLKHVDLVITGEGKIDRQTASGKLIKGILEIARPHKIPVMALCGTLEEGIEANDNNLGLSYVASILRKPGTLEEALASTYQDLESAAFNVGKLITTFHPETKKQ